MVKQIKDLVGLNTFFEKGGETASVFSFPADGKPFIGENISAENFIHLDYSISNPRLLMSDNERKISGKPFSQSVYSSHLVGFIHVSNIILFTDEEKKLALKKLKTINRSEVKGASGFRSALVSCNGVTNGSNYFMPFLISPTVFFNFFRAKIGFGNLESDAQLILKDLSDRLDLDNDSVYLFNTEDVTDVENWTDFFNKKIEDVLSGALKSNNASVLPDSQNFNLIFNLSFD